MLFKWLKEFFLKKPFTLNHPSFGQLYYYPEKGQGKNGYWQGEISDPFFIENEIGLTIEANKEGPVKEQEEFFKNLFSSENIIEEKVASILEPRFVEWTGTPFPREFFTEFKVEGMTIPEFGDEKKPWDISFISKTDINHSFTVFFENGNPVDVTVDG